jgi:hypothetical protein
MRLQSLRLTENDSQAFTGFHCACPAQQVMGASPRREICSGTASDGLGVMTIGRVPLPPSVGVMKNSKSVMPIGRRRDNTLTLIRMAISTIQVGDFGVYGGEHSGLQV